MPLSDQHLAKHIMNHVESLRRLRKKEPKGAAILLKACYRPDPRIKGKLAELRQFLDIPQANRTDAQRQAAGYLLEDIAFLAFLSIDGAKAPESFRNPGFQIDLYVSGDDPLYIEVMDALLMGAPQRGIVVECKATEGKVDESTFSRLCCIFEQNFGARAGLAVFFTLEGATGWKTPMKPSDARIRQIVHAARTERAVVVLDEDDVFRLDEPGALLEILAAKVDEVFKMTAGKTADLDGYGPVNLPNRLTQLLQ